MTRLFHLLLPILLIFPLAAAALPQAVAGLPLAVAAPPPSPLGPPEVSPPVAPADTAGLSLAVQAGDPSQAALPAEPHGGFPLSARRPAGAPLAPPASGLLAGPAAPDAAGLSTPLLNIEGLSNVDNLLPADPVGAVGRDHYVQMVNTSMAIYDKRGLRLSGPFHPSDLWPLGDPCNITNDGDPIVLYDQLVDRWLVSQFAQPNFPDGPYYQCMAVSKTGLPTQNPRDWWPYSFQVSAGKLNDYTKLAVWPDGYYMTANQFAYTNGSFRWAGAGVWVFDRSQMLAGRPARFQHFDLFNVDSRFGGMLPTSLDGPALPPPGSPNFFLEVDPPEILPPAHALRLWKFHVDWSDPTRTTFGQSGQPDAVLPVDPFSVLCPTTRDCIPQKGAFIGLDAISDRLMFRSVYRNFGAYQSIAVNHTVGVDGNTRAGIRWLELRDPNGAPFVYQSGDFAPADGLSRWMGSLALDRQGNLALGYSVSGPDIHPSIRYAGRLASDPPGALPRGEGRIIDGGGAQLDSRSRWGDYSAMTVDPLDDCTFWYTQEYLPFTGLAPWSTRIASFRFDACTPAPSGRLEGAVFSPPPASQPLPGVSLVAADGVRQFAAHTGASGEFSLDLPPGDYTLSASLSGYQAAFTGPLAIAEGGLLHQDLTLQPLDRHTLTGRVSDARTGLPLYAWIEIAGYEGSPLYTDPLTGRFSVALPEGASYDLVVKPWSGGYLPAARSLAPLAASQVQDFALQPDPAACSAPGYEPAVDGLYETFDSITLPAGWTQVDNAGSGALWRFDNPAGRAPLTGGSGGFAILDSDFAGDVPVDVELRTPILDLSGLPQVSLSFRYDFFWYQMGGSETASVDVSANGPLGPWYTVWERSGASDRGPKKALIDLTALSASAPVPVPFDASSVMVRFRYSGGRNDWWWQVDDVLVGALDCRPLPGGLVFGSLLDARTGQGLVAGDVLSDLGAHAPARPTLADPAEPDGFYLLFLLSGRRSLTASANGYAPASAALDVTPGSVQRLDFRLSPTLNPNDLRITLPLVFR